MSNSALASSRLAKFLLGLLFVTACGEEAPEVRARFQIPVPRQALTDGFYALPYPNDLRILQADGHIDLTGIQRPNELLGDYIDSVADRQKGFGISSAMYLRFDGAIDPESLPATPSASVQESASVYLVNVDASSDDFGEKLPLEFRFQVEANENIGANWLGCLPFPGFVMAESTTYALVASKRVLAASGPKVKASDDFLALMSTELEVASAIGEAREIYAPFLAYLDLPGGDERSDVVSAAVFTTQDATGLMGQFREIIERDLDLPEPRELVMASESSGAAVYLGRYDSPHFQEGRYPYRALEHGGGFAIDPVTGEPILQGINDLRFSMSVPKSSMPSEGWPVLLYAHGTGGDYRSYERDGTAKRFTDLGIAVVSIDQVMHGDRLEGDGQNLFFNFLNPLAARGNVLQAGLEGFQLTRLVAAFDFTDANQNNRVIRFDSEKMAFFGHSQGSVTGLPFVAFEPKMQGAIFSGAGGLLYLTMLSKTLPFDVTSVMALVIRDKPLDRFHPALSLLQGFFEPADAISYGRLLVDQPPAGNMPKHILHTLGVTDLYTPIPTIEALATSIGLDIVVPQLQPVPGLDLRQAELLTAPISGNAAGATALLAQYEQEPGSDGHFVVFDIPAARLQTTQFIKTLFDTGTATLVPAN